jgi:hypothetical protein
MGSESSAGVDRKPTSPLDSDPIDFSAYNEAKPIEDSLTGLLKT